MCKSTMRKFLAAAPKCEHHMHLEGSLSPELLFELAAKNNITLPSPSTDSAFTSVQTLHARYQAFTSLDDFLAYYYIGFSVLVHQADFESLAWAYFTRVGTPSSGHNVRHAEVFFDPQVHVNRGIPLATVVDGFAAAARRAEKELGMSVLLIPCLLRHLSVDDSERCVRQLIDGGWFANGTLAGLGLCSTERDKPPSMWRNVFALAKEKGGVTRFTAHAGEEGPAEYVAEALDALSVSRIDHGVRARESEAVMTRLAKEQVMLSVCPISNVVLRGVSMIEDLPIRLFLEKEVRFSINSDDPAYFGGYLLENYYAVQDAFGLGLEEWGVILKNGIEGSWCSDERKAVLIGELKTVVEEYRLKV